MTVICTALSPETATEQMDRLFDLIDAGYAAGENFVPKDFDEQVKEGRILIWIAFDDATGEILTAVTTELIPMRCGLVCWIGQCSGHRMREWAHFHLDIEKYARDEGCVKTVVKGREGWGGVLEGYSVRNVTFEKVLK